MVCLIDYCLLIIFVDHFIISDINLQNCSYPSKIMSDSMLIFLKPSLNSLLSRITSPSFRSCNIFGLFVKYWFIFSLSSQIMWNLLFVTKIDFIEGIALNSSKEASVFLSDFSKNPIFSSMEFNINSPSVFSLEKLSEQSIAEPTIFFVNIPSLRRSRMYLFVKP